MAPKNLMEKINVHQGDITTMTVDAIVNAANTSLRGGGGVDGAIHRAAGPDLLQECIQIGGCPTGEARITKGYQLPAHFIIHTVGPVWHGGNQNEDELLANCYRNSLDLAEQHGVNTIAFPNISTGVYGFPKDLAADIAIREVKNHLMTDSNIDQVKFVCFDQENYTIYQNRLDG